eukprot:CAMPEP_0198356622 /NCGR_PEP_ID=MMETSP1450-20131203/123580_1 /TAXON_ID=753684 ORGANISM="Madagascaria erythrocladiodes, Strain CCMP3234" /NCGR_SAMPLE_ID=MMETSP1450 /ASSEMBLY_ACC=CAM_ASM_001115 /LENGTH=47 /DNA_ID= /DNA_START= /DNA_END= /DNA_ORIENTATION=
MSSTDAKVAQLRRTFGAGVDADVLRAVLEVTDGDVRAAQQFLEAQGA